MIKIIYLILILPLLAAAGELRLYAAVEIPEKNDRRVFCGSGNGETSNLGAQYNFNSVGDIQYYLSYAHHSCVAGPDTNSYNAVGAGVSWIFDL